LPPEPPPPTTIALIEVTPLGMIQLKFLQDEPTALLQLFRDILVNETPVDENEELDALYEVAFVKLEVEEYR
jgi:hypothetical protein